MVIPLRIPAQNYQITNKKRGVLLRAAILWHTHSKVTGYAIAREVELKNYTDTEVGTG
jgi:hypothetical protein